MINREKEDNFLLFFLSKFKETSLLNKFLAFTKKISWKSLKTSGVLLLTLVLLGTGIFYLATTTPAVAIIVNGNNLGFAPNLNEAQTIIQDVLSKQGETVGRVAKTSDNIEYDKVRIKKEIYANNKVSPEVLFNSIKPYIEGVGINVNDKFVVVLGSQEEADSVLAKYIEHFTKPSEKNIVSSAEFKENISKISVQVNPNEVKTIDQAFEILLKGDVVESIYTVEPNDSFWLIARKNNMLTEDVIAGNPGFTENTIIQPGQKIKLVKVQPYLTVISKGTKIVNEVIPFDVVTKVDSKLAAGKSVVQQAGKDGEKIVTYNYVEENGKTITKEVVKEEIVVEPVKQIIAKGPNPAPVYVGTSRGSGSISGMIWPLSGPITSYYGYRWGGFHTGIDIDGVTGQPYVAAASGKVVFAGWNGGYGYSILIDHGNGVVTRYAHSSKLNVKAGQNVEKGQTIGLVGSTGRSTGSHLHFEVIINGSTVNPLNYL
ncbi:MAG TPA: peptidoglycan DD-metalloendopeptidase family protein [Peptococcaceae bacterium]|nr:peptidoglycan DD-metalloendopeptidase family protein [Peptococcaceae bacterium]